MVVRRIDYDSCTSCGNCIVVCPQAVLAAAKGFPGKPEIKYVNACTACWMCVERCAFDAIEVQPGATRNSNGAYAMHYYLKGLGLDDVLKRYSVTPRK